MISAGARRLYRQLLELGPAAMAETTRADEENPRVSELVSLGLVRDVNGTLWAIPPRVARSDVARAAGRQSRDLLQTAVEIEAFLDECLAANEDVAGRDGGRVAEIVSDESEVSLLSYVVPLHARREVCSVNTARFREGWKARSAAFDPTVAAGITYRVIYPQACFDDPFLRQTIEDSAKQGEEPRVHPDPPLKFKVVDRHTVLVPVDDTGAGGALLIRSTAVAGLFGDYFERLWAESTAATQLRRSGTDVLKPLEIRILSMFANDASDATIANRLRISERSLRRHVSVVLSKLGTRTRTGALAVAIRRGLVT